MPLLQFALWAFLAVISSGFAQESPEFLAQEREKLWKSSPAQFAPVTDDPALPRVLLIGDSISTGYTLPVRDRLRGVANVHRAFENCGPTTRGLQQLSTWLGAGRWDVIHFNFGLHDLARRNGGNTRTSLVDYERNLRTLVTRLQATGARLIFATTTPVPVVKTGRTEDAIAYNDAARRVMAEFHVPINDLFTFITPRVATLQKPNNVHFTPEGSAALAEPVAASIQAALRKP